MYSIANDMLEKNNINFKILLPLIKKTITNLEKENPKQVQTGPAKRKDIAVIQEHLVTIKDKEIRDLYQKISAHIIKYHE
jgi:hypothetical protein